MTSRTTQVNSALSATIERADKMMGELKDFRRELLDIVKQMPKGHEINKRMMTWQVDIAKMVEDLKQARHQSNEMHTKMVAHKLWSEAVFDRFGKVGLETCYEYMQARLADEIPAPAVEAADPAV